MMIVTRMVGALLGSGLGSGSKTGRDSTVLWGCKIHYLRNHQVEIEICDLVKGERTMHILEWKGVSIYYGHGHCLTCPGTSTSALKTLDLL